MQHGERSLAIDPAGPNPYAPPTAECRADVPERSLESLFQAGPIAFSGSLDEQSLRQFLRHHGHVRTGELATLAGPVAILLFILAVVSPLSAIAGIAVSVTILVVSTIPYRSLVFKNLNPLWDQPIRGELRMDGVHCQRDEARSFFRWDWYWGAVVAEDLVALIPATQPAQPLILTRSMLMGLDDWSRLLSVCQIRGIVSDRGHARESQRRRDNLDVLQQAGRPPTIEPRPAAIPFRGSLSERDFDEVPAVHRQRRRPPRAYVVNAVLAISLLLVLAAISQAIFAERLVLPTLASLYVIGGWIISRNRLPRAGNRVYYVNGFADQAGWVSDFAIHTSEIGWSNLRLVTIHSDRIIMRRRGSNHLVMVRRDMFEGDPSWQQVTELVRQQLNS